jgi:hypothetical protein
LENQGLPRFSKRESAFRQNGNVPGSLYDPNWFYYDLVHGVEQGGGGGTVESGWDE